MEILMPDRMQSETLCTARRKSGQPCRNYALRGTNVCRMHGGSAPQVRRAAAVRILMASDLAAARLVAMMQDTSIAPALQLAAARDLLDRAGLNSKQEVAVNFEMAKWEQAAANVTRVVEEYVQVPDEEIALAPDPAWQEAEYPDRPIARELAELPAPPSVLQPRTPEEIAAARRKAKADADASASERYEAMLRQRERPFKPRRATVRRSK